MGQQDPRDAALERAIGLVGQTMNPVEGVQGEALKEHYRAFDPGLGNDDLESKARSVGAFRYPGAADPRIFVNTGARLYQDAAKRPKDPLAQLALARTLVHEQVHNTEWGPIGEAAAKRKEADWYREKAKSLPGHLQREADEVRQLLDMRAASADQAARKGRL